MLLYGVDVRFYMQIENELRCICNCVKMTTICLLEQVIPLLARTWSSGQAQAYPSEAWELSRQMYWHPLLLLPQGLVPANPNTISIWQSRIESVVTCSKNTQWHRYCSARGRACNRQDFEIGRISFTRVLKYVSITGVLSCTLVTTCAEQFWTLFGTKNFVLCCFPSLTVQEVQISREHVDGEKRWVISLKGVALVQWSQCTWFLVMMRVFFEGSVENLAATWPDVLFIVHTIDSAFTTSRIRTYTLFLFCRNNNAVIMCSRCTYTVSIW